VLCVVLSGAGNHTVSSITNTGTALTWNRVVRRTASATATGNEAQNEEIWYALNTSSQTGITYTVNWTEGTSTYTGFARGRLQIITGHDTTTPFPTSVTYSGTLNTGGNPQSATAITNVTGGAVIGVFTDGNASGTLSSSNADYGGPINGSGTQDAAFFTKGISSTLAAGSFQPSMGTTSTDYTFTGVFAVLAPSSGGGGGTSKRGPGIGRY
jgi:hypothetical protein